ncbi:hypothetical protein PLEOSDRAFT_1086240 [Pleurotus ostreatus PC15]|uniref:Uncharacterized protein n=1 Tax=Pleurotus ostreatus (strain PC15) TaxID=1137138 RepID=A0A067N7N3_PLEO1|nr:hypothetical protein PLEOSDRAFT_1086240 [Pleurotus ostreatus PC15]
MPRAADTGQMDASSIDTWDLPFAARDFAMDPTQDLVIFLEDTRIPVASEKSRNTHLYIYSMATKEPHQLAQSPCLVINGSESESLVHPFVGHPFIMCALLQIAEDVVLIQYTTLAAESVHVRLWNWMTGDLWLFGIRFRLFVPNRVLLSYAAMAPGHAPMLVPWDTWGPDGADNNMR